MIDYEKFINYLFISFLFFEATFCGFSLPIVTFLLFGVFALVIFSGYKTSDRNDVSCWFIVVIYLVYFLTTIIRGLIDANGYWELKTVFQRAFWLLLPSLAFCACRLNVINKITTFSLKPWTVAIVLFLCVYRFSTPALHVYFYSIVLLPYFCKRDRILLWVIVAVCLFTFISSRSFYIRIVIASVFPLMFYLLQNRIKLLFDAIKPLFWIMVIVPSFFLYLGYSGIFNVFAIEEYYGKVMTTDGKENLTADSRSSLYKAVNYELNTQNHFWIGNGTNAGYWKGRWKVANQDASEIGRTTVEAGFAEQYLIGGAIGVILFSLMFWIASYLAIYKSNSQIIKIIGLFLLFRWITSFTDESSSWYIGNMMNYLFMGLCLSKSAREMTDEELIEYFNPEEHEEITLVL